MIEPGEARHRRAAEPGDDSAGAQHGGEGAHGHREQRGAEGGGTKAQALLDQRDLWRPAAEDRTIGEEDDTDRESRPTQRAGRRDRRPGDRRLMRGWKTMP